MDRLIIGDPTLSRIEETVDTGHVRANGAGFTVQWLGERS